jgi:CheY-like chemotaxis protein
MHHTIVIADDEPGFADILKRAVAQPDRTVLIANNGEDALDLVRSARPAVVILDLRMPGLSGVDVCEEIKRDPDCGNAVVIVSTASREKHVRARVHDAGATAILSKPYSLRALTNIVDAVLPPRSAA